MDLREVLSHALGYGQRLGENEARVAEVPGLEPGHRVWFGADHADRRVAYLEIDNERFDAFAVSRVLEVTPVETTIEGNDLPVRAAKVVCRDARLNDVFTALIADVVSKLGSSDSLRVLLNSIATWRKLLQLADHGLSNEAATGLYGELRFLEELVERQGPQALAIWQVHANDVHDFVDRGLRIEVKASTFQNQHAVTIHGLKQLDAPSDAQLFLAVAEVQMGGQPDSIDLVVDRLLDRDVDVEVLSRKLEVRGFVRGMSSATSADQTFSIQSWRYWRITAQSPVLSASQVSTAVSSAVSNLSYSLNLSSLGDGSTTMNWELFSV